MAKTEYTVLKRIIFTFLLALVTALAVNAQSLTGKQWCTVLNDEDLNNQFNNGKAKVDVDYEIKGMDAKTKALLNKQLVVKNSDNQEIPFYADSNGRSDRR